MSPTTPRRLLRTAGRLAAVAGLIASLLCLAGVGAVAGDGDEEPSGVVAFPNAPGMVTVTWSHTGEDVYSFVLEQEAPYAFTTPDRDKRAWSVPNLEAGRTYRYRVCAVFDFNRVCSDWVAVTTLPPPPPSGGSSAGARPPTPVLKATARSAGEIYLTWEHPGYAARLTSAALYRDGRFLYEALQPGNFDGDHVDVVAPGSVHRYHFCFKNPDGEACSAPLTRSPLAPPPAPPTEVRVGDFTASSAVIRWVPGAGADEYAIHCLDLTDQSRCGFPYTEAGGRMGVDRVRNPEEPVTATTHYTLGILRPGHRYEVAVCASQDRTKYGLAVNPTACAPGMIWQALALQRSMVPSPVTMRPGAQAVGLTARPYLVRSWEAQTATS